MSPCVPLVSEARTCPDSVEKNHRTIFPTTYEWEYLTCPPEYLPVKPCDCGRGPRRGMGTGRPFNSEGANQTHHDQRTSSARIVRVGSGGKGNFSTGCPRRNATWRDSRSALVFPSERGTRVTISYVGTFKASLRRSGSVGSTSRCSDELEPVLGTT